MTDSNTTPDGSAQPPSGDGSAGPSAVSGPTPDADHAAEASATRPDDDAFYDHGGSDDVVEPSRLRKALPALIGGLVAVVVVIATLALTTDLFGGGDAEKEPAAQEKVVPAAVPDRPGHKPMELLVPSIGLEAKVVPIATKNGVLTPPDSPMVGWWNYSARAGSNQGQMLITGHTIHTGGGIMNKLGSVRKGSVVRVKSTKGTWAYRTTSVEVISKEEIAKRSKSLFGQKYGQGRLVLVTCDDWDGEEYLSNIVLFAEPIRAKAKTSTTSAAAR